MAKTMFLSLPTDILVLLPNYLDNIEDYMNLSSTSRALRDCLACASPGTILRLVAAQTRIFFRPSPQFLVAATARQLGAWARRSSTNEVELQQRLEGGIDALLEMSLEHCGLTMERIRELHEMRFSLINPAIDLIDKCVGQQWLQLPNFWTGGVSDAATIFADASDTLFQWVIYGELFSPDFDAMLCQDHALQRLSIDTRLEFIKYCLPNDPSKIDVYRVNDHTVNARCIAKPTGPYAPGAELRNNNPDALIWVIESSRFKPHLKAVREEAGPDFLGDYDNPWWERNIVASNGRQRMWEARMLCQGFEGLDLLRPQLRGRWVETVRKWREQVEMLPNEPTWVEIGEYATISEYPFLYGDLKVFDEVYVLEHE